MKKIRELFQQLFFQSVGRLKKNKMFETDSENEYLKRRVKLLEHLLDEKSHSIDRAKSIFLKNLYHEIRTPLNSIVGFTDLIEMNNLY